MSLQAMKAPIELIKAHVESCDIAFCDLCLAYWIREMEADEEAKKENGNV